MTIINKQFLDIAIVTTTVSLNDSIFMEYYSNNTQICLCNETCTIFLIYPNIKHISFAIFFAQFCQIEFDEQIFINNIDRQMIIQVFTNGYEFFEINSHLLILVFKSLDSQVNKYNRLQYQVFYYFVFLFCKK